MDGMSLQSRSVLLVDDDSAMRLLCRVNLEHEGHTVHEAATLTEAREQLELLNPDVVLLDLHIGHEDGLELLDEIHALDLPTRVVLLSGSSEVGPSLQGRVAGVLGKPFELDRLAAAIADCRVR